MKFCRVADDDFGTCKTISYLGKSAGKSAIFFCRFPDFGWVGTGLRNKFAEMQI